MHGSLNGIRILDLTHILAGPFATTVLGDLGADVIKVERPDGGDPARGTPPFLADGYSSYFFSINRSKRSITLDLTHPRGKELLLELVSQSDVLIENFLPGTMARFGLDYPVIQNRNPALIYAAISGFGQTGPYAQRPALDIVVQAMGGIVSITGELGGRPILVGASLADVVAGLYCTIGILAALQERATSGKGQMLDISMLECQIAMQTDIFARYFTTGEVPQALGRRHIPSTPFQAYETKDSWVVVAITGPKTWPLFCAAIDRVDLIDDERYTSGWLRTEHHDELDPVLSAAIRRKTTQEWLKVFSEMNIPCSSVNTIDTVVKDPQVVAREAIAQITHPVLGEFRTANTPLRLSRTPARVEQPAPDLGEHTDEVLTELLGLSSKTLAELRGGKVI